MPIWKKEVYADGKTDENESQQSAWKANQECFWNKLVPENHGHNIAKPEA